VPPLGQRWRVVICQLSMNRHVVVCWLIPHGRVVTMQLLSMNWRIVVYRLVLR
jgi:hypothetical protein